MSRVYEAVKALALCHNVTPVIDEVESPRPIEVNGHIELKDKTNDSENIVYQAASPDEVSDDFFCLFFHHVCIYRYF